MTESYNWVLRAISSSTNAFHVSCCHTLIELFSKQYGESIHPVESLDAALREREIELMVEA